MILLLKLTLAPTLVVLASLAGRRWGQGMGGFVSGFPIVAGPILLLYCLEQGNSFGAEAATGTLLGLVSLSAYCVFYARARSNWWASLLTGWGAFALCTWMLRGQGSPWWAAWMAGAVALLAGYFAMPALGREARAAAPGPWDLPLRAGAALALVLLLTALAKMMGPTLSGLLTPFPVASSVLTVFAHRHAGAEAGARVLKGMLLALQAFAVFCALLALLLPRITLGGAFFLALLACGIVQALLLPVLRRSA